VAGELSERLAKQSLSNDDELELEMFEEIER
jgi:hypothetical protein